MNLSRQSRVVRWTLKRTLLILLALSTVIVSDFALAETIHFDFENQPDASSSEGVNPTFVINDLTLNIQAVAPDVAQWTNDRLSRPHAGHGSMRLSGKDYMPFLTRQAEIVFSSPIGFLDMYVENIYRDEVAVPDLIITATTSEGVALETVVIEPASTLTTSVWQQVTFAGLGHIHRLRLTGMTNHVYWDDLTVTMVPEPVTRGLYIFAMVLFPVVARSVTSSWRRSSCCI